MRLLCSGGGVENRRSLKSRTSIGGFTVNEIRVCGSNAVYCSSRKDAEAFASKLTLDGRKSVEDFIEELRRMPFGAEGRDRDDIVSF